jgi:glycosyltransferase involved in cell wall biosynthesis
MPTSERPLHVVSMLTTHAAGGAEFAAVDMLAALAGRGARVRLLTNRVDLVAGTCVPASPIALGPKLRSRTLTRVAVTAPLTLARLLVALRREAPIDVLLMHYKKEQLLSALVPRSVAGARVWAEWGPLPPQVRSGWARLAYAQASRCADVVIAESPATASSLAAAGVDPAKIVVVPNVLDAGELAFDPAARANLRRRWGLEGSFVLGCISRLDAAKRIDVAIDALGELDARVALVIAGEGEDEPALRRRAARHGDRVLFVGGARGRVAQILSACDVQVYAPGPSEGAARAVTFGQLVGRPVIATGPEGARDLIVAGTGTIVAPAHDVAALARCVESYRADPGRVAEEGLAGRAAAVQRIADANAVEVLELALHRASLGRAPLPRRPPGRLGWPRPEATRRRRGQ